VDTVLILESWYKFEVNINQDSVTVRFFVFLDFVTHFSHPGIVSVVFTSDCHLNKHERGIRESGGNVKHKNRW
jgi:hypothetical protein